MDERNAGGLTAVQYLQAMPKLFAFLALAAACTSAQSIKGSVVNSLTGDPIQGVTVQLLWTGNIVYTTTTDDRGAFRFDHVEDEEYSVNYASPNYEQDGPFHQPPDTRVFRVKTGAAPIELVGHMMPTCRISGRVVDPDGAPVPKTLLWVNGPGLQLILPVDSEGRFDLHDHMLPGAYTLAAMPPSGLKPPAPDPESGQPRAWATTWYPRASGAESASRIVLRPGGDFANIELKLLAVPSHSIRGVLLYPDGAPAGKIEVTCQGVAGSVHSESKSDGAFEFPAVPDGVFRLSAATEHDGVKLRAGQWIEMAGHDRDEVKLTLDPPVSVRIDVVNATPAGPLVPKLSWRFVLLQPVDPTHRSIPWRVSPSLARPDSDGHYTLDTPAYPDRYEIHATSPPGYYLDAIQVDGSPLSSPQVELSGGSPVLSVIFKAIGGSIRGAVENCAAGGVFLIPLDPGERWSDLIRTAACDAKDHYEVAAVRPGEYFALPLAKAPGAVFWDRNWDDSLLSQATRVTIRSGETTEADLRAIVRPAW